MSAPILMGDAARAEMGGVSSLERIEVQHADRCVACLWDLRPGDAGLWDPERREVRCLECDPGRSAPQPPVTFAPPRAVKLR